jgi:hypothetical protein
LWVGPARTHAAQERDDEADEEQVSATKERVEAKERAALPRSGHQVRGFTRHEPTLVVGQTVS